MQQRGPVPGGIRQRVQETTSQHPDCNSTSQQGRLNRSPPGRRIKSSHRMFRKTRSCCWGCSPGWGFCTHTHVFLVGCCRCCRYPREVGGVELPALGLGWHVHFPLGLLTSGLGAVVLPRKAAVAHQGGAIVQNCQCIVIIKSSTTVRQFYYCFKLL